MPMSFERVLLPTDGREISEPAETRVIEIALEAGASVEVVHVLDALALPVAEHKEALLETLDSEAHAIVDRVVQRAQDAGVAEVSGTVTRGKAAPHIVDIADELGCDLIVMGTHGRAENQPYILGSVTVRVLRHSPVEVLVVPTHSDRRKE
jgi:nucleotide-binding universal stress UspA family protein